MVFIGRLHNVGVLLNACLSKFYRMVMFFHVGSSRNFCTVHEKPFEISDEQPNAAVLIIKLMVRTRFPIIAEPRSERYIFDLPPLFVPHFKLEFVQYFPVKTITKKD